jgi:hypothetical protein
MSSISGSEFDTTDDVTTLVEEDNELSEKRDKVSEPILWFICPNLLPITINLGIYKNILNNFEDKAISDIHKLQVKLNEEENPRLWTMLMIVGGHFAALVLDVTKNTKVTRPEEVKTIIHKTFHRYTSEI